MNKKQIALEELERMRKKKVEELDLLDGAIRLLKKEEEPVSDTVEHPNPVGSKVLLPFGDERVDA